MIETTVCEAAFFAFFRNKIVHSILLLMIVQCATSAKTLAQAAAADTLSNAGDVSNLYMASVGSSALLFTGPEYTSAYPGARGVPFFPTDRFARGMVSIKGTVYHDILMAYDAAADELVIKGPQQIGITLQNVDSFQIEGHLFERYPTTSTASVVPAGYFEVLYRGKMTVLTKRRKVVQRGLSAEEPMQFGLFSTYYVRKAGGFLQISGRRMLLRLLPGRSKAIKLFWRNNHVNYKRDPEGAIVATIRFISS